METTPWWGRLFAICIHVLANISRFDADGDGDGRQLETFAAMEAASANNSTKSEYNSYSDKSSVGRKRKKKLSISLALIGVDGCAKELACIV